MTKHQLYTVLNQRNVCHTIFILTKQTTSDKHRGIQKNAKDDNDDGDEWKKLIETADTFIWYWYCM